MTTARRIKRAGHLFVVRQLAVWTLLLAILAGCVDEPSSDPPVSPGTDAPVPPADDPDWLGACQEALEAAGVTGRNGTTLGENRTPIVDGRHCNILVGNESRLHAPVLDLGNPDRVQPLVRNEAVDWLYVPSGSPRVVLLPGGAEPEVVLKDDFPVGGMPPVEPTIQRLAGAWMGDELHVMAETSYPNPGLIPDSRTTWHFWWNGSAVGEEILPGPMSPYVRSYVGLAATETKVTIVASDEQVTDILGLTEAQEITVWESDGGAMDSSSTRSGIGVRDLTAGPSGFHACANRGSEVLYAKSPAWNFEPLLDTPAQAADCRISVAGGAHVLAFGLPLVGAGGGGEPGTEDGVPYRIASHENGTWVIRNLDRTAYSSPQMGASARGPFFVDSSQQGTQTTEAWALRGDDWVKVWGQNGPGRLPVSGFADVAVAAAQIADGYWDYDGWAAVALTPSAAQNQAA